MEKDTNIRKIALIMRLQRILKNNGRADCPCESGRTAAGAAQTAEKDCELEFVTTEDEIGHKTYQRSLSLLLVKAVYHVGGYDKIRHVMLHFSAGSGFFYTVDGDITLNQEFLDEVKAYMHEQVEKAVPIYKRSVDTHEARERFRLHGMTDKDRLFRYRRVSRVNLYSLGDFEDYYYGFMTYDTSYLKYFDLYLYDDGFVLQMPEKKAPETVPAANLSRRCSRCSGNRSAGVSRWEFPRLPT